jgi:Arc/MetJ family transcription regulator
MARTLVDIPEEKIARAMKVLGTSSKRATIEGALDEVIRRAEQRDVLQWALSDGMAHLDETAIKDARR